MLVICYKLAFPIIIGSWLWDKSLGGQSVSMQLSRINTEAIYVE